MSLLILLSFLPLLKTRTCSKQTPQVNGETLCCTVLRCFAVLLLSSLLSLVPSHRNTASSRTNGGRVTDWRLDPTLQQNSPQHWPYNRLAAADVAGSWKAVSNLLTLTGGATPHYLSPALSQCHVSLGTLEMIIRFFSWASIAVVILSLVSFDHKALVRGDARFIDVRNKLEKDRSGRKGDSKDKYFRKAFASLRGQLWY